MFAQFFDYSIVTGQSTTTRFSGYTDIGGIITNIVITSGTVFGLVIGASFFLTGGPTAQLIGAASLIALITGLWNGLSMPLAGLFDKYPDAGIFYTLLVICIGVVSALSIIEIFTFKGDES